DRDRGQGIWPPEGPFRDLPRHRIRRSLSSQAEDRDRRRRRSSRRHCHCHPRQRPDGPYRRRQDRRPRPPGRHPPPHLRDRRGRALPRLLWRQLMNAPDLIKLTGLAWAATLLLTLPGPAQEAAPAAEAVAEVVEEIAPAIDTGDTAWMLVSTIIV